MTESQVTCLPFFWKFLYKRFEFNLVCTEFQNWKDFLLLYSQFENKKSKNANLFARVAFLSALLSYAFSFEAKILFVIRCICAFQSLNSSNKHFLGYNLKNWRNYNESCNITQIAIRNIKQNLPCKEMRFLNLFSHYKGGWKKVHTHGKEFELWRKLFCSKCFPFVNDVWNFEYFSQSWISISSHLWLWFE